MYTGSLTITNNGMDISGTSDVALNDLTPEVTLANAAGTYQSTPYITATTNGLAAGASATVQVQFKIREMP
jgi:hypothetical protein